MVDETVVLLPKWPSGRAFPNMSLFVPLPSSRCSYFAYPPAFFLKKNPLVLRTRSSQQPYDAGEAANLLRIAPKRTAARASRLVADW